MAKSIVSPDSITNILEVNHIMKYSKRNTHLKEDEGNANKTSGEILIGETSRNHRSIEVGKKVLPELQTASHGAYYEKEESHNPAIAVINTEPIPKPRNTAMSNINSNSTVESTFKEQPCYEEQNKSPEIPVIDTEPKPNLTLREKTVSRVEISPTLESNTAKQASVNQQNKTAVEKNEGNENKLDCLSICLYCCLETFD